MIPTAKLRYIERKSWVTLSINNGNGKTLQLQQWWEPRNGYDSRLPSWRAHGEWRDVEIAVDKTKF